MSEGYLLAPSLLEGGAEPVFHTEYVATKDLEAMDASALRDLFLNAQEAFWASETLHRAHDHQKGASASLADIRRVLLDHLTEERREGFNGASMAMVINTLLEEHKRQNAFLHAVADTIDLPLDFGTIEEEGLLRAVAVLVTMAGKDRRLPLVLDLIRGAHHKVLMGSAPGCKADLGEAARLLAALIDGRE